MSEWTIRDTNVEDFEMCFSKLKNDGDLKYHWMETSVSLGLRQGLMRL